MCTKERKLFLMMIIVSFLLNIYVTSSLRCLVHVILQPIKTRIIGIWPQHLTVMNGQTVHFIHLQNHMAHQGYNEFDLVLLLFHFLISFGSKILILIGQSHDFRRAYSLFVARVASIAPERSPQEGAFYRGPFVIWPRVLIIIIHYLRYETAHIKSKIQLV